MQGLDAAGILTLPQFANGNKVNMEVQSIRTGERRVLAERGCATTGFTTEKWFFQADAKEWGSEILSDATPCDVLGVDELGPLEIERGEGWHIASVYCARDDIVQPLLSSSLDMRSSCNCGMARSRGQL